MRENGLGTGVDLIESPFVSNETPAADAAPGFGGESGEAQWNSNMADRHG